MPQETLGYVEMEWSCKRCGTKNPGLQKTCKNCGAQMEAGQQFEKPAEGALVSDAEKLAVAKKGADVSCPFCGTRNQGDAKVCANCGGDLAKAEKREAGQVVGAHSSQPAAKVKCPACATENAPSASNCVSCGRPLGELAAPPPSPAAAPASAPARPAWVLPVVAGVVALCLCGFAFLLFQLVNTTDAAATVQAVRWERIIGIEARGPVEKDNWRDRIPADAEIQVCEARPRETRDAPDAGRRSEKVCGTPYQVDMGNGLSEVRQDCQYQIYDDYCSYTVLEWREVDTVVARGADLRPAWPAVQLQTGQREGPRREQYDVEFSGDGATYTYAPDDEAEFRRFEIGTRWTLKVNGLGAVTAAEPAP